MAKRDRVDRAIGENRAITYYTFFHDMFLLATARAQEAHEAFTREPRRVQEATVPLLEHITRQLRPAAFYVLAGTGLLALLSITGLFIGGAVGTATWHLFAGLATGVGAGLVARWRLLETADSHAAAASWWACELLEELNVKEN